MYKVIKVVKFNDKYFEHEDEIVVTKKDGSVKVGSLNMRKDYEEDYYTTDNWRVCLDISEKYHKKMEMIGKDDIETIQKVNK